MARDTGRRTSEKKDEGNKFPQIKLITPPLRMSYPKIFDPVANDQGKDVWEIDALVEPDLKFSANDRQHDGKLAGRYFDDVLLECLEDVMTQHFGREDEWPRGRNDYEPKDKIRFLDPDKLPGPGVDEKWQTFKARSYAPVGIVDADKNEVLNKREAYGGRWCRLSITITVYDQSKSKGPAIYLNNVQLLDNAESFGGRQSAEQDFDGYEDEGGGSRDRGRDRDRGRGDRDRRSEDRADDRGRRNSDRDGRSDRERDRGDDRRDSRRDDNRDSGRSSRDDDRGGRDREEDRGRGSSRDDRRGNDRGRGKSDEAPDDRDSGRGRGRDRDESDRQSSRSSEKGESRGRDDDRGRDRENDRDGRDRGYRGRDRHDGDEDRGRDRDGDRESDRRPSDRGGSRGSRDDDQRWN